MGIGVWELLIILAIVLLIFGAKRLRSIGSDLGGAIKSFKQSMKEGDQPEKTEGERPAENPRVVDAEIVNKKKNQG
jgi:sec-independent protein translocase protein TatA